MKKLILALLLLIVLVGAFLAWTILLPNTNVDGSTKYLYIRTGQATRIDVMKTIRDSNFLKSPGVFEFVANRLEAWSKLKPGKYELSKGTSILTLVRKLRNGTQVPVNLTITKIRTKEQLAAMVGRRFETDSARMINFLNSPDSLKKYDLDSNTVMAAVFPDTYTYRWTSSPSTIFEKLYDQYEKIWTDERKAKAAQHGLSPVQAYTLASIIEEETNINEDKPLMASVYMNRLKKGMRLGADPTVKFALKDFDLRRIYQKHLQTNSPYNTYRFAGLPPGPICTPSLKTLDAVLNAPQTDYLYFVAKSDFSQKHVFTTNYADHLKYAREYQQALNKLQEQKKAREETGN
jgi:UPF0755 protein